MMESWKNSKIEQYFPVLAIANFWRALPFFLFLKVDLMLIMIFTKR